MATGHNTGKKNRPPRHTSRLASETFKDSFLTGQPLFELAERDREACWQAVISEAEPRDKRRKEHFTPAFKPPILEGAVNGEPTWRRLRRDKLVVALADPSSSWRRVALVCGAGLGKTTNLKWLEAALNRPARYLGKQNPSKQLAFFLELKDKPSADNLIKQLIGKWHEKIQRGDDVDKRLQLAFARLCAQGRITLLLDSLDQAGPHPDDSAIRSLKTLLGSYWSACPIWVSGRPHAFRLNREFFLGDASERWQFLRIGQLDEPECRFLLDDTHATAQRRQHR